MSNFYRSNYVIRGEQVRRVIDANDRMAERMHAIEEQQRQERLEEMIRQRREEAEANGEEFSEGLFAQELLLEEEPEPEIDYVAQAKEQAQTLLDEARQEAEAVLAQAKQEAESVLESSRQEGYQNGYDAGQEQAQRELRVRQETFDQKEQELQRQFDASMEQLEPQLLDTMLTVFEHVFTMQFRGKKEMLEHLVWNALRGIRETRQYKIRVSESELEYMRSRRQALQEKVGEDVALEIVMDPDLTESQCVIDADSGVYDCSLDVELDQLIRDLKSLCIGQS